MITRPASLCLACSSFRCGIAARQGPHQVPQKSSRTTFPLSSASLSSLPSEFAHPCTFSAGGDLPSRESFVVSPSLRSRLKSSFFASSAPINNGTRPTKAASESNLRDIGSLLRLSPNSPEFSGMSTRSLSEHPNSSEFGRQSPAQDTASAAYSHSQPQMFVFS